MSIALKPDVFSSKATQDILAGNAQIVRGKDNFEVRTLEDGEEPSIYTQACRVSEIARAEEFGKLDKNEAATQLNKVFDHVVKEAKKHNEELTTFARILNITLRIFTLGLWGSNVIDVTPLEASRAKLLQLSQISQTDLDAAKANEEKAKKAQEEAEKAQKEAEGKLATAEQERDAAKTAKNDAETKLATAVQEKADAEKAQKEAEGKLATAEQDQADLAEVVRFFNAIGEIPNVDAYYDSRLTAQNALEQKLADVAQRLAL